MSGYYRFLKYLLTLTFVFTIRMSYAQDNLKIYADPDNAPGIKASKFIDSIDFIPLETSRQSKYSNSYWFILSKNQIVMMDDANNAVFLFDKKTGKFLYKFKNEKRRYKINSIQYVPSKNAVLIKSFNRHYTISNAKGQQLIKRWQGKDISKYTSLTWLYPDNGFKRASVKAPSIALNQNLTYFDGGFLYRNYINDKYNKDSVIYRIVQYDSADHIKHRYFPFLNLARLWSSFYTYVIPIPVGSILNKDAFLVQVDFDPAIYELSADTIIERYRFIFPTAKVMPANYNSLKFKNNIDFEKYKEQNSKTISYFNNILQHGKYLILGTETPSYDSKQFLLLNHTLYDLGKLISDSSIYNLPPNLFSGISRQDNDYLYTITDAATILRYKKSLLENKLVSQSFKNYLSKMTPNDNNIVIRVKLK